MRNMMLAASFGLVAACGAQAAFFLSEAKQAGK